MSQEKLHLLESPPNPYVLVIHGGAGTMSKEGSTLEQRAAYKAALVEALQAVCIPYLNDFVVYIESGFSHRAISISTLVEKLSTPWWLL
jgi:hypothetical protein